METHGIVRWLLQEHKIVFLLQEIAFTGLEIAGILGWVLIFLEVVAGLLFAAIRKYGHPRLWCNGRKLGRGPAVHRDAEIVQPTPEAVEAARYLANPPTVNLMTPPSGPSLLDLFDELPYGAPPKSNPFL